MLLFLSAGVDNFCNDLEFMSKKKVGIYWRWTWGLITPLVLIIIFIYFCATITRLTYGSASYPDSALCKLYLNIYKEPFFNVLISDAGWAILVVSIVQLILWTCYTISINSSYGFPEVIQYFYTEKCFHYTYSIFFTERQKSICIR